MRGVHYRPNFLPQIFSDLKDTEVLVSVLASGFPKQQCPDREQPPLTFFGCQLERYVPLATWFTSF